MEAGNNGDFYSGNCHSHSLSCDAITLNRLIIFAAMQNGRTVALHTLGCKLNYSETSAIERMLINDVQKIIVTMARRAKTTPSTGNICAICASGRKNR